MQKLLIVSHDVVGSNMAGPGIRYWELARALSAHARVTLVAPRPINIAAPGVTTGSYVWGDAASLAAHLSSADVALVNGFVFEAHPDLAAAEVALIVDLYDPTLLENLELLRAAAPEERVARTRRDVELLNRQVAAGDFFLCATERQRDLYIGVLMAAGRITPARVDADPLLRGLIDVLPFGLPSEPPVRSGPGPRDLIAHIGPADPIILWSGGLWDWMDPQTLIRAMPTVVAAIPNVRLVFMAGNHPGSIGEMRTPHAARTLADELGLLGSHIFFYESWVPYEHRADFLLDAAIVVSLHRQHLETAYAAVRSRFLDHLWAGRASLVSAGDAAAELVAHYDLGRVAPPEDVAAVAKCLTEILTDASLCEGMAGRAQALAAHLAWPEIVRPITNFLVSTPMLDPQEKIYRPMNTAADPISPPPADAARVEREQLLYATRNAAIQALEHSWRLDTLVEVGSEERLSTLRQLEWRLLWPLLQPLLAQQQDQNAAVLRALYAVAEQNDQLLSTLHVALQSINHAHLRIDDVLLGMADLNVRNVRERHLLAQQLHDLAGQLVGLEEADIQVRALLRGDLAPPPAEGLAKED
jgi:glycosyltransferase involved in cell wall biosynthesis